MRAGSPANGGGPPRVAQLARYRVTFTAMSDSDPSGRGHGANCWTILGVKATTENSVRGPGLAGPGRLVLGKTSVAENARVREPCA